MNKQTIIPAMLAAVFALTSCQTQKAEAEQQAYSTEIVTNADTLRLVMREKAEGDSVVQAKLKLPLDSLWICIIPIMR